MGQVALGFRSLLTKAAIFFVMAALLAWALGGTLWPRAVHADLRPGRPASLGDALYFWRVSIEGGRPGRITQQPPAWRLMRAVESGVAAVTADERIWTEGAGPVAGPSDGRVYFGGRDAEGRWWISRAGAQPGADVHMPDRLAVERQLARLAVGLALQDSETIVRQRSIVLDPADE